jgi:hypothetical protein
VVLAKVDKNLERRGGIQHNSSASKFYRYSSEEGVIPTEKRVDCLFMLYGFIAVGIAVYSCDCKQKIWKIEI